MNQRPRAGETEEDLLRLQANFLAKKSSPSATVKKADKRKASDRSSSSSATTQVKAENVAKDVVTLQGPGLPPVLPVGEPGSSHHPQKRSKFKARHDASAKPSIPSSGQRVTFDLDDEEDDPEAAMERRDTHITAVLSRIQEHDTRQKPVFLPQATSRGFPTALHRSQTAAQATDPKSSKKRSLFAQQFESTPPVSFGVTLGPPIRAAVTSQDLGDKDVVSMETEDAKPMASSQSVRSSSSSSSSTILEGTGLPGDSSGTKQQVEEIHSENMSKMATMSEEEILEEQAKLKAALDPSLVAFLKSRKQGAPQITNGSLQSSTPSSSSIPTSSPSPTPASIPPTSSSSSAHQTKSDDDQSEVAMETSTDDPATTVPASQGDMSSTADSVDSACGVQVDKNSTMKVPFSVQKKWLNMKTVEEEKLEWISDIPRPQGQRKGAAKAQARFDFSGRLVARDAQAPVREGLYHHGDEQEVPGYTLEELFSLSRSAVIQQRVLALQTLARLIYNYRADNLGGQLRSPLISRLLKAGVLFLLRWSIDDTNEGVLSAAAEGLAALLVQPGDEEALDKAYTWHQGCCAPPMLPCRKTEEEKEEEDDLLDDEDDEEEEEEEGKQNKPDEHIASQDVIKGILKMSLLPRLRYILEVVRPTPPVILNILSVLVRIARHSAQAALEVFKCPRLLDTIFKEFLPTTSWVKQEDPVSNLYGHPTVLAMKLARVMCLSGRHIAATMISRYPLLPAILRYTSLEPTNMNLNVGEAFHLSTESFRAWSACVRYGLACDAYRELYPLLMQQLQLFQRLSVLPLPSTEDTVTCLLHRLQLIRAASLISLLEGVVQVAGTAAELQAKLAMRNDATNQNPSREVLTPPPIDWSHVTGLATPLETCACRWLVEMTGSTEVLAPEASSLAASALEFLATFYAKYTLQPSYNPVESLHHIEGLVNHTLLPYMQSTPFFSAVHNLQTHSSLKYSPANLRKYSTHALPSFCCHHDDSNEDTPPCVQRTSTFGFGIALFRLSHQLIRIHKGIASKFEPIVLSCYVLPYLEYFCNQGQTGSSGLAEHFAIFEHTAVYFLIKLFQCVVQQVESCKHHSELYHTAAMRLFALIHPGCEHYAHDLMSVVLFTTEFLAEGMTGDPVAADLAEFLTVSEDPESRSSDCKGSQRHPSRGELLHDAYQRLPSIRNLYLVYFGREVAALLKSRARSVGRPHEVVCLSLPTLSGPLLPVDWLFLPLVQLYSEARKAEMKGQSVRSLPPHIMAAVTDTLRWVYMLETWRPLTLRSIPLVAKIARLYCVFLTASDLFMEPWVHHYLGALLRIYVSPDHLKDLDFDQTIPGLASFQDLFDAMLSQYEAVSFGDQLFAHYVLLPLQQRFMIHLRKAVWMDHIDLLRTLAVHPAQCLIPIENFVEPSEKDPSLVEVYFSNLVQGKVRAAWSPIMHLVAVHHVVIFLFESVKLDEFKECKDDDLQRLGTQLRLMKAVQTLQNQELKQTLLLYNAPDAGLRQGYSLHDTLPEHRASQLAAAQGLMGALRSRFGGSRAGAGGEAKTFEERLWVMVSGEKK